MKIKKNLIKKLKIRDSLHNYNNTQHMAVLLLYYLICLLCQIIINK